jgi:hypothetical protein
MAQDISNELNVFVLQRNPAEMIYTVSDDDSLHSRTVNNKNLGLGFESFLREYSPANPVRASHHGPLRNQWDILRASSRSRIPIYYIVHPDLEISFHRHGG